MEVIDESSLLLVNADRATDIVFRSFVSVYKSRLEIPI